MLEDRTLLSFLPIAQPDVAYQSSTNKIAIPGPDFTPLTSITDGTETVSFSQTLQTFQTVTGDWGSPPNTESSTPNELFQTGGSPSTTLTLSTPASEFGVEAEWVPLPGDVTTTFTLTATFYEGANIRRHRSLRHHPIVYG